MSPRVTMPVPSKRSTEKWYPRQSKPFSTHLRTSIKLDLKGEPFGPPTTLAPTNDAISGSGRKQNPVGKKKNLLSGSEDLVCR